MSKIPLVDDAPHIREIASASLRGDGFEGIEATQASGPCPRLDRDFAACHIYQTPADGAFDASPDRIRPIC